MAQSDIAGKVKCIYIDPPYNTESDSFGYNDTFKRSTWLTFMKNRLMLARKLLSNDGIILIQISFHQYPYLRVMTDEVLGEKSHKLDFNVLVRHPDRNLTGDKEFNDVIEYTLVYSKSSDYKMPKEEIVKTVDDYIYDFEFPTKPDESVQVGNKLVSVYYPQNVRITEKEGHESGLKSLSIRGSIREKNSSGRFYVAYLEPLIGKYPKGTIFTVPNMGDDGRPFRIFELPKGKNKNGFYYPGKPKSSDVTLKPYANFINMVQAYNGTNYEGDVSFRNGEKPEALLAFYLNMFTKKGDIILDFFAGSGTTAAVAHKMGRKYITCEQMDYVQSITAQRLINTIDGEQGGISKDVGWQGGGSFVYCELKERASALLSRVAAAEEDRELTDLYRELLATPYLSYRAEVSAMQPDDAAWQTLTAAEKKEILMKLVDKNKLYVNDRDRDDAEMGVTEAEKRFTDSFYHREGGAR